MGTWSKALRVDGATTWIAVHANHPRELSGEARAACARLADAGIPLVSQTVLLRGVNDDAATLEALMRAFVENRIKPYYLHHGDLAPGTAHLRTTIAEGQELMRRLRGRVSGLCQPEYVLDIPGGHGKAPIGPNYLSQASSQGCELSSAKRGIVSSTIAATFTSIRQSRDLRWRRTARASGSRRKMRAIAASKMP